MRSLSSETKWQLFVASFSVAPFYVAPFVVLTLLVQTEISPVLLGLFPAAVMSGLFLVVTLLPFVARGANLKVIGRAAFSLSILILALVSVFGVTIVWLVLLGASLGVSSGILFYFGTTVALDAEQRFVAFLTRLAFSLIWAGSVVSVFALLYPFAGLRVLFMCLAAIYSFLFFVIPNWQIAAPAATRERIAGVWHWNGVWALALVFVFFVGQTGFYSFHAAIKFTEVTVEVLQLSLPRIAAGILLLTGTSVFMKFSGIKAIAVLTAAQIISVLVLFSSNNAAGVFLVICVYEIAFNLISSHVQSAAGQIAPAMARRFLSPAVIGGAIAGPVVCGALITHFSSETAIAFVLLTCAMPVLVALLAQLAPAQGATGKP